MNNQSQIANRKSQIAIVGAGPAGASLAIRLAKNDFDVCLIEREKFPRHKLCGEFISPECLTHFAELEVLDEMLAVGGDRITETVFYAPNGKNVTVPSEWFAASPGALSISRAEMDFRLMEKARSAGARVLEETQVVGILFEKGRARGVKVKSKNGETFEIAADLTIDATGRANVLGKLAEKFFLTQRRKDAKTQRSEPAGLQITNYKFQKNEDQKPKTEDRKSKIKNQKSKIKDQKPKFVGFKSHLENVNLEKGRCEIYFFRGGYGGLSFVENNLANHCFLIKSETVREFSGDAEKIVGEVVFSNKRAFETMKDARAVFDWLAVSIDGFGVKNLNAAKNLLAVGDAAAFIDPFTGSGMLMAMESAEILAQGIVNCRFTPEAIAENYRHLYREKFQRRLWICQLMRRAAFAPNLTKTVISALSLSRAAREILARATRHSTGWKKSAP